MIDTLERLERPAAELILALDALLRDVPALERVRDRSYRHPNGFIKIPISRRDDGSLTRLHYWGDSALPEANIHSHRWDMDSLLLRGSYRAKDYREAETGLLNSKYRCSENRDGRYVVEHIGTASLSVVADRKFSAGDHYLMKAGLIHWIDAILSSPVISLVTCSVQRSDHSLVYAEPGKSPIEQPPQTVGAAELRRILDEARQAAWSLARR